MRLRFKSDQSSFLGYETDGNEILIGECVGNIFNEGEFDESSVIWKNQTTDKTVSYSKILNNYVENSGFPNFMEVVL